MRVFLSYHTPDEQIARDLKTSIEEGDTGIEVYFAPYNLRLGAFWLPALSEAIDASNGFIILIGEHGLGSWQKLEYYEAIDRRNREPAFPLVPVIIGSRAPGLPFLRQLHWIAAKDFSALSGSAIVSALRTEPAPWRQAEPWRTINPYRGLLALKEEDAEFFFGRDEETSTILHAIGLACHRLVVLVGNSGVGKSSLVQAGIIGALKRQRLLGATERPWPGALKHSRRWAYLTMKPGDDPVRALTNAFTSQWFDRPTDTRIFEEADNWAARLSGKGRLSELIDAMTAHFQSIGTTGPTRVCLYIDQGEELYARPPRAKQTRFSEIVREGLADDRLTLMMSLRSDYYGHLQSDEQLFPATERIDVPPLSADSLTAVLREPARVLGARFDSEDLVSTLVRGVRREPGALPLLADFMTDLWKDMQTAGDGVIRLSSRTEIIHLGAALARRADDFLSQNPTQRDTVKRLFSLKLALVQEEGEPVRRRVERANCTDAEWALVEQLTTPEWRLLVTGQEHGVPVAEVAHEVLLREWPTLRTWLADQRDFLVWLGQLERNRKQYDAAPSKQKFDALLLGRALSEAEQWLQARPKDIGSAEAAFIKHGISRRNTQRKRIRVAASIAAALLLAFAGVAAVQWAETAGALALVEQQKSIAEQERSSARLAEQRATEEGQSALRFQSTYLAEYAKQSFAKGDMLSATLLALEALPDEKRDANRPLVRQALDVLASAYFQLATQRPLSAHGTQVTSLKLVPGTDRALTTSHDGTARIWDLNTAHPLMRLSGHFGPITSADVSSDGKLAATASRDSSIRVWNTESGQLRTILWHDSRVNAVTFSPDGQMLASGTEDGRVRLWEVATGATIREFAKLEESIKQVAFSPDGRLLLASDSRKPSIWETDTGKKVFRNPAEPYPNVESAQFSPDGTYYIEGTSEKLTIFRVANFQTVAEIALKDSYNLKIAVSSNGQMIAVGRSGTGPAIYETTTGREISSLPGDNDRIHDFLFTADSRRLIIAGETVQLWDVRTGKELSSASLEADRLILMKYDSKLAFTAEGSFGVLDLGTGTVTRLERGTGYEDKFLTDPKSRFVLQVRDHQSTIAWSPRDFSLKSILREKGSIPDAISFSPDGLFLAAAGYDESVRIWRVDSMQQVAEIATPASKLLFSPTGHLLAAQTVSSGGEIIDLSQGSRPIDISQGKLGGWAAPNKGGQRLFACDYNSSVGRLWNLHTGKLVATIVEPDSGFTQFGFDGTGSRLITRSSSGAVRLYDSETGGQIAVLGTDISRAWFGERSQIVAGITPEGEIVVWDANSGAPTMRAKAEKHQTPSISLSDDGARIVAAFQNELKVWDTSNGREIASLRQSGNPTLSPDRRRLLVRGSGEFTDLTIWETETGQFVSRLGKTWKGAPFVYFSSNSDASRVVAYTDGGSAELFDGVTGAKLALLSSNGNGGIHFVADGKQLVVAQDDGRLELWDAISANLLAILRPATPPEQRGAMALSTNTSLIAIAAGSSAAVFDGRTGARVTKLDGDHSSIRSIQFSQDSSRIAITSDEGQGFVFDAGSGAKLGDFTAAPDDGSVILLNNGQRIISVYSHPLVTLFETSSWHQAGHIRGHHGAITSMSFSADGRQILTSGYDGARIADSGSGREIVVFENDKNGVNSAVFSPDEKMVLTASNDRTATLWDASTGRKLRVFEHPEYVRDARFSQDGRQITTMCVWKCRRTWRTDTGELVSQSDDQGDENQQSGAPSPDRKSTALFARAEMRVIDNGTGELQLIARLKDSYGTRYDDDATYIPNPMSNVVVSEDGRTAVSRATGAIWQMLWGTQNYVDHTKDTVPRCLTPDERKSFNLEPAPPPWCIELRKWPYNTDAWAKWLTDTRAGRQVSLPSD